jgi:uncharacterized protein YggE
LEDSLRRFFFTIVIVASTGLLLAQDIQVNRQNKTISVTADESATADAEVAVLTIGYHNYGLTQDAAFQKNVQVAKRITKALLDAKVPKANIETDKLTLARTEINEKWTADMKKERQFEAGQSWHVTVSASEAQVVVDLAVRAGANEVDDVEWSVADPLALQAKAGGAALAKAKSIADQMAKGLGARLGELVYASNRAPVAKKWQTVEVDGR